jgi:hypothetical protein
MLDTKRNSIDLPMPDQLQKMMTKEDLEHEQIAQTESRLEGLYSDEYEIYISRLVEKGFLSFDDGANAVMEYASLGVKVV